MVVISYSSLGSTLFFFSYYRLSESQNSLRACIRTSCCGTLGTRAIGCASQGPTKSPISTKLRVHKLPCLTWRKTARVGKSSQLDESPCEGKGKWCFQSLLGGSRVTSLENKLILPVPIPHS